MKIRNTKCGVFKVHVFFCVIFSDRSTKESLPSLVVIGDYHYQGNEKISLKNVDIYHLNDTSITWVREGKPSPMPWTEAGSCVGPNAEVFIGGGEVHLPNTIVAAQDRSARYHFKQDRWELLKNLTTEGHSFVNVPAMFSLGYFVYAVTGHLSHNGQVLRLPIRNEFIKNGWKPTEVGLSYRIYGANAVAQINDSFYIIGSHGDLGKTNADKQDVDGTRTNSKESNIKWVPHKTVTYWKPRKFSAWSETRGMNIARIQRQLCVVSDNHSKIWVIAGCSLDNCGEKGFVEERDLSVTVYSRKRWVEKTGIPDIKNKLNETRYALI